MPDHVHQEMANKRVDQMQLKLASSRSPISRPKILYNRLWRFPFKPPALLGVIGSLSEWIDDDTRVRGTMVCVASLPAGM
jgi:hypothetical protein